MTTNILEDDFACTTCGQDLRLPPLSGIRIELDRLRKALEFYADGRQDRYVEQGEVCKDRGGIAREALRMK